MHIIDSFITTPNTNLLDVLGHSGYTLQSAIADIIDNSISAKAKNIWIYMNYAESDSSITIVDDGIGMELDKLKQACIIAFKNILDERTKDDLGRFSTGINSASASMCNQLIIQSKTSKNINSNTIMLDYKKMKTDGWKCNIVEVNENYLKSSSGTAIVWRNLKQVANANSKEEFFNKIEIVENHISHVFNDYLDKEIQIHINNDQYIVPGWNPFFIQHTKTALIYDEQKEYHNSKIGIKIYILPPYNNLDDNEQAYMRGNGLSDQQGFYIYRNKRLIKEGGWLDINDLSISNKYDYARIRVDIESILDRYFNPNFLKNEIFIPDDLRDYFKQVAIKARQESHKNFNYMKAPTIMKGIKKEKQIPVWNYKHSNDGIVISVNDDHPIIKSLVSDMKKSDKTRLFKLLSKNIPIGEITRSGVSQKQNTYVSMVQEMEDMYNRLKEDKLTNDEIQKKMSSCEPFCLEENISSLIEYFLNKGVL